MPALAFFPKGYLMADAKALMLAAAALGMLASPAFPQAAKSAKTEARFLGGFSPDACRFPREARRQGISACCVMDLDIGANGRVLKSEGQCTDPSFLVPTQRCLAAQSFMPATVNGQPVRSLQSLEYEWRAEGQVTSLCRKLTS
jgi:hypothetical protein